MVKVSVKWQKEIFSDLIIDKEQPPIVFKGQLFALTGVPPERQKIMVKGGLLQDDGEWAKYSIKEGQRLMMMGTAEAVPQAPAKAAVFVEDLPPEDQDGAIMKDYTAGLENLGNTCYMNSTLQCLRSVPELRSSLSSYTSDSGIATDSSHKVTVATRDLFANLQTSLRPVAPFSFLQILRQKFPQFAQTGQGGAFMQQDAEECWSQIMFALSQRLRSTTTPSSPVINDLFGINMSSRMVCVESGEESTEEETTFSMKCHINSEVNEVNDGLKLGLKSEIEKNSPALGRPAVFIKESLISRLPQHLTIQFVRFFWKRESQQKAKILRTVTYPVVLDIYGFCTKELQAELDHPRKALRLKEEAEALAPRTDKKKEAGSSEAEAKEDKDMSESKPEVEAVKVLGGGNDEEGGIGGGSSEQMEEAKSELAPPANPGPSAMDTDDKPTDVPSSSSKSEAAKSSRKETGIYDLTAVLTHMGRSADSGHYVAWVKQESGQWIEFDDDKIIYRKEEDISRLSGGGDWHMAYILLYKARTAPSSA